VYSSLFLYTRGPVIVPVFNARGEKVENILLPKVFSLYVRKDLIRRVFFSEFTARLQPKGRDPMAGRRTSAVSLGPGYGVARVPRIKGTMRAALVNMARGGRAAHPPRVEKRLHEEVNKKERLLGTMSALAATSIVEMVRERGHVFTAEALPVIVDSEVLEAVDTVKSARELLTKLGVYSDIERAKARTRWKAGKGKMRGRRYVVPRSILFIVEDRESPFARSVKGFPGVDIAEPRFVNVLQLAPGGVPGRLTVITTGALRMLEERFRVETP
jgi:large subunit ribosomal protein L4e